MRVDTEVLLRILTRRFDDTQGLRYMSASRMRVSARPPLPTQLDGEQLGVTPLEVEAVPEGVLLIVPQAYTKAEAAPALSIAA